MHYLDFFDRLVQGLGLLQHDGVPLAKILDCDRIFVIGNGGSCAVASHVANDYTKKLNKSISALNDPAIMTCLSNDIGYEQVYSEQLRRQGRGYGLIAISSSGKSASIINAADLDRHSLLITLSGFDPHNPLRTMGDGNYYIPSTDYGVVEICHLAILHSLC